MPSNAPTEDFRCLRCDRILTQSDEWDLGTCRACEPRDEVNDILLFPSGSVWLAVWNPYAHKTEYVELLPTGATQETRQPGAVLLARHVKGKRLPVVDLGTGELFGVETVA